MLQYLHFSVHVVFFLEEKVESQSLSFKANVYRVYRDQSGRETDRLFETAVNGGRVKPTEADGTGAW